jgi:hypothetical protein
VAAAPVSVVYGGLLTLYTQGDALDTRSLPRLLIQPYYAGEISPVCIFQYNPPVTKMQHFFSKKPDVF